MLPSQVGSFFGNAVQLGKQCAGISTILLMTGVSSVVIYYFVFLVGMACE